LYPNKQAFETLNDASMRHAYDCILANHSRGRGGRAGGSSGAAAEAEPYREDLYDRPPPEDKVSSKGGVGGGEGGGGV
jgi:DnaJ-class molecular chaperone